jgi:hypothetical protein
LAHGAGRFGASPPFCEGVDVSEFETGVLQRLDSLVFLVQVAAVTLCILWGAYTWRLIVLAKNQRSFW